MKLTYRPEIDGLRGIAVVAVILYHAQITLFDHNFFKGGFIGVDIFFVISGYLITSLILKELEATGQFSFLHFYERRTRRLLPALFVVMLASLPFAWIYLIPPSFIDFCKSILYSLGFSSNFYFHYSGAVYGAESGWLKPFLHTWSLSVEEQYYLIFPIFLIICFKYFRKYLISLIILGIIISLMIADWGSRNHPSFNFYVLPTRGWELLAGSLLAKLEINRGERSLNKILNQTLPILGLFLISYSIVFYNDEMFHPSFLTLSPIIGVCLLIWFSHKDELITKMLSSKLFVGTGLISYSLYLWHYVIFTFGRITQLILDNLLTKGLLIVFIIGLSIFTYFFVEKKFRNKKAVSVKSLIISLVSLLIVLVSINFYVIHKKGFVERLPEMLQKEAYLSTTGKLKKINYIVNKQRPTVLLVGDSHMNSLAWDLKNKINKLDLNFSSNIFTGCQFILNLNRVNKKTFKSSTDCNIKKQKDRRKFISSFSNSIVVLGGRLPLILSEDRFNNQEGGDEGNMNDFLQYPDNSLKTINDRKKAIFSEYKNTLYDLLNNGHYVILVYPIPEVGWNVPNKLFNLLPKNLFKIDNNKFLKEIKDNPITTSYDVYKQRTKESFGLLDSIQHPNLYRVYPHTLFCDNQIKDRCITHDNKDVFYKDDDHPSTKGAEMINELIMKKIEKIEANSN